MVQNSVLKAINSMTCCIILKRIARRTAIHQ